MEIVHCLIVIGLVCSRRLWALRFTVLARWEASCLRLASACAASSRFLALALASSPFFLA